MANRYWLAIVFFLSLGVKNGVAGEVILVPRYFNELSAKYDVPADVLYALAVKETNTRMTNQTVAPWPYTLNVNSKGYRYASYEDMIVAARKFMAQGIRSIDVGLFQVNWRWNGHRAESLEHLGIPSENGRIASEILKQYYAQHGDWVRAAGQYHNPANNDGRADRYARGFKKILKDIQSGEYQKNIQTGKSIKTTKR